MRTSNPVFRTIENTQAYDTVSELSSYRGISFKTLLLLLLATVSGYLFINYASPNSLVPMLIGSMVVAFIAVMIGSRSPNMAMPMGIVYALAEGILLGTVTALIGVALGDWSIPITALIGTATIFTVMLFLYSSRIIRVTSRFRKIVYGSLLAVLIMFIIFTIVNIAAPSVIASFYNIDIAIGVTIFLIILGAFMLTLDFERAEAIVAGGYDKRYEWMVAIGLMVTIVWIYVELLRLLILLSARNR